MSRSLFVSGAFAACLAASCCRVLASSTVSVLVEDDRFVPQSVTNNAGDTVKWTWQGVNSHSSTGSGVSPLWDSGIHGNGFTFSHTFSTAGSFPYRCEVHSFQTGSVVVKALAANSPPAVAITWPTNGSVFAAPWSATISAKASDADGQVTNVAFFAGPNLLGAVGHPGTTLQWPVSQLPAGQVVLTALATDNAGATNVSAAVTVSVLAPAPILLTAPEWISSSTLQFTYSATPGLSYIISRSSQLGLWTPVATNTAAGSSALFVDPVALDGARFYSVSLAPNP